MRRALVIGLAAAAVIGLGLGLGLTLGTGSAGVDADGVPLGPVSCGWIRGQNVTGLVYPGATVLKTSCQPSNGSGSDFASEVTYFISSATGAEVYRWYDAHLSSLGWSYVNDGGCYDYQVSCPAYQRNGWTPAKPKRMVVGVAIEYPRGMPIGAGITPPPACTVYESDVLVFAPSHGRTVSDPKWARFSGGHQCWWTGREWRLRPPP